MSSSILSACDCEFCPNGAPPQYMVNIGAVGDAICDECTGYEGSYTLDLVEATTTRCRWELWGSFPCGPVVMFIHIQRNASDELEMTLGVDGSVIGWSGLVPNEDCLYSEIPLEPMDIPTCDNGNNAIVVPLLEEEPDCIPLNIFCDEAKILLREQGLPEVLEGVAARANAPLIDEICRTDSCPSGTCGSDAGGQLMGNDAGPGVSHSGSGNFICTTCTPEGGALDFPAVQTYASKISGDAGSIAYGWNDAFHRQVEYVNSEKALLHTGTGKIYNYYDKDSGTGVYKAPFGATSKLQTTGGGGWKETTQEFWQYEYDSVGKMTSISNSAGAIWTLSYVSGSTRLSSIESPVGRRMTYSYDGSGNLSKITDAGGRETLYEIDGNGDLVKHTTPELCVTSFSYNASHRLTTLQDPTGSSYIYSYDVDGRITGVQFPDGGVTTYEYNANDQTIFTNQLGNISTMTYDATLNLLAFQNPLGEITSYSWKQKRLSAVQNPLGNTTQYDYYETADSGLRKSKMQLPGGEVYSFAYDSSDHLEATVLPLGNCTTIHWNGGNQKTAIENPFGYRTTFAYAANSGLLLASKNPLGAILTSHFDSFGNLEAVENPLGYKTSFTFNAAGQGISTINALGFIWTQMLDTMNRVLTSQDPLGGVTSFTYNLVGQRSSTENALGYISTVVYDSRHRKIAEIDQLGHRTSRSYDAIGNPISFEDEIGAIQTAVYDSANKQTAISNQIGEITEAVYDKAEQHTASVSPLGFRSSVYYNTNGRAIARETPLGERSTTLFDANGRPYVTVNPLGARTTKLYDVAGQQIASISAIGNRTTTLYSAAGKPVVLIDPLGCRTTTEYDIAGRRTGSINSAGNRSSVIYSIIGQELASVNTQGSRTTTFYDAAGRPLAVQNALGNRTTAYYDLAGREIATENALGHLETKTYDNAGQLISLQTSRGYFTTTTYDSTGNPVRTLNFQNGCSTRQYSLTGNVISVTDPNGNRVTTTYDLDGRENSLIDALGNTATTVYDEASKPIAIQDAKGNCVTFVYDVAGRRIAQIDALGRFASTSYNQVGFPIRRVDSKGNITTFTYDPNGRPTGRSYPDGSRVSFAYDTTGSRIRAIDGTGTYTYAYTSVGRLASESDATGRILTYEYDAVGNLTTMLQGNGVRSTYTYNAIQSVLTIENTFSKLTTLAYDEDGNRVLKQLSNGTRTSYVYGPAGHAVAILCLREDNSVVAGSEYTYDLAGNRVVALSVDGDRVTWLYDANYRLTREISTGTYAYDNAFAYDSVGNRIAENFSGYVYTSTFDSANQLMAREGLTGTTSFTFDLNGNMTAIEDPNGERLSYLWNYDNQVVGAVLPDSSRVTMTCNAATRRISIMSPNQPELSFQWSSLTDSIVEELSGASAVFNTQLPVAFGEIIARQDADCHFYHFDVLGSTIAISNEIGGVEDTFAYNASGTLIDHVGLSTAPYRFHGAFGCLTDLTLESIYVRQRSYAPDLGRWLSEDPSGFSDGVNRYIAHFLPNGIDPSGLQAIQQPVRPPIRTGPTIRVFNPENLRRPPSPRGPLVPGPLVSVEDNYNVSNPYVAGDYLGYYQLEHQRYIAWLESQRRKEANDRECLNSAISEARERGVSEADIVSIAGSHIDYYACGVIGAQGDFNPLSPLPVVCYRLSVQPTLREKCEDFYKRYKDAQGEFSKTSCKNATTCTELAMAIGWLLLEIGLRQVYLNNDCDSIQWNPPSPNTAKHQGQVDTLIENTLSNCWGKYLDKLKCDRGQISRYLNRL